MSEALKKRLLDPSFKYVHSSDTDISRRFRMYWAEQQAKQDKTSTVCPLKRKGK